MCGQVKDLKKGSDGKWTVTTCVNGAGAVQVLWICVSCFAGASRRLWVGLQQGTVGVECTERSMLSELRGACDALAALGWGGGGGGLQVQAKFVFVGAGGWALLMLQKAGIPEVPQQARFQVLQVHGSIDIGQGQKTPLSLSVGTARPASAQPSLRHVRISSC